VSDRQAELVATLIHDGCSISEAARRLDANRTWASKALTKQHVVDYMNELASMSRGALRARAYATAHQLLSDSKSGWLKWDIAKSMIEGDGEGAKAPAQAVQINISLGE
jgi:hypothetical protein